MRGLGIVGGGLLVLALGAAGCGGGHASEGTGASGAGASGAANAASSGGPSSAPAAPHASGGPFVVVPLRVVATSDAGAGHSIELRADGGVYADERQIARFVGTHLEDPTGRVLLEVSSDGHLLTPGATGGPLLTDDGSIVAPDGARISVLEDGSVEARSPRGEVDRAPMRFESLPANARRTAVAIVALALIPHQAESSATEAEGDGGAMAADTDASAPGEAMDAGTPAADAGSAHHGHARHGH